MQKPQFRNKFFSTLLFIYITIEPQIFILCFGNNPVLPYLFVAKIIASLAIESSFNGSGISLGFSHQCRFIYLFENSITVFSGTIECSGPSYIAFAALVL